VLTQQSTVVAGSDTGYIYSLYGVGYIQVLELLQEAGFHPLEVIRAATKEGSKVLKWLTILAP
jgi:hypothetical protein